jgi:hypothetical protein
MSEENVETVRRVYELFNQQGPEAAREEALAAADA